MIRRALLTLVGGSMLLAIPHTAFALENSDQPRGATSVSRQYGPGRVDHYRDTRDDGRSDQADGDGSNSADSDRRYSGTSVKRGPSSSPNRPGEGGAHYDRERHAGDPGDDQAGEY